jgi:hypothetical protein
MKLNFVENKHLVQAGLEEAMKKLKAFGNG